MLRFLSIALLLFYFFSCKEKKNTQQIAEQVKDSLSIVTPDYSHQLIKLTPEFIGENKINEWSDFKKFKDAMEDMTQLNPLGIMTFITELYEITSALLKAPFPEDFDKLPVYGRVKVVQTQIIKCHFYASNKQNEKLNKALDELYLEYNILLKRMISMAEENKISFDSIVIDMPNNQIFKTTPILSKK